jgi:pilus assembly protein CpaE
MPGKPGCGASTLAAYLAIEMKRSGISKVLLVDADSVTGSIAFLLKLKGDFHLGDAVRDWQRLDDDLWGRLVVPSHGVDVLLAPENPATRVEVTQQIAFELLTFWRSHYQAIVLDLPGVYSPGFEFAAIADEILLVTTNELAALHATGRTLEYLEKASMDRSRIKLVVTRYLASTGLKREDVQTALRLEPYALLSNDYDAVQAAVLDGRPVTSESHLGRGVHALTERLLGKPKPAKKRSTLFGFLPHRS